MGLLVNINILRKPLELFVKISVFRKVLTYKNSDFLKNISLTHS